MKNDTYNSQGQTVLLLFATVTIAINMGQEEIEIPFSKNSYT